MDQATMTAYQEILSDIVESEKIMESLEDAMKFLKRKGEGVLVNFFLFVFYTVDRVSVHHAAKGFTGNEELFYEKLQLIEGSLEQCATELDLSDEFNKAIDVYSQHLNKA